MQGSFFLAVLLYSAVHQGTCLPIDATAAGMLSTSSPASPLMEKKLEKMAIEGVLAPIKDIAVEAFANATNSSFLKSESVDQSDSRPLYFPDIMATGYTHSTVMDDYNVTTRLLNSTTADDEDTPRKQHSWNKGLVTTAFIFLALICAGASIYWLHLERQRRRDVPNAPRISYMEFLWR